MSRKRLTERFPWLIPLRTWQRKKCFYLAMRLDGRKYCDTQKNKRLGTVLFESACPMYNPDTGFDMVYQENKVFNLKLAAKPLDGLLIRPGETFSFSRAVRYADRETRYRDGLTVVNGRLTTAYGGGLCQISNLLFWVFLHSPLTIVERHGHRVKDFPEPPSDAPIGVDATVSEGWLDLKVTNDTRQAFQIGIEFDAEHIIGRLYVQPGLEASYQVHNGRISYVRKDGKVYERAEVIQTRTPAAGDAPAVSKTLYVNQCEIGYSLPEETIMEEE